MGKAQRAKKEAAELEIQQRNDAALVLQCFVRVILAKMTMRHRAKRFWQRVYDPKFKIYFWYNRLNAQSQWTLPKYVPMFTEMDIQSAIRIEKTARGFVGRMKARRLVHAKYTRFFDANLNRFYWMTNATQKTTWKVSNWLVKQEVPLPPEDEMIYKSVQKIKELEERLLQKDLELKEVRMKRYEELEPQVLLDRVTEARNLRRSRNMDEWSIDDLAAWFTEMKLSEHIPFLYANR